MRFKGRRRRGILVATGVATALAVAAPGTASAAKPSCSIASPVGERTIALTDQGVSRPFLLYVPPKYKKKAVPLVLDLHPTGSSGAAEALVGDFANAAGRKGYAVVAPNGAVPQGTGAYAWNVPGVPLVGGTEVPAGTPSDEVYLLHVIKAARKALCVDPNRIFMTGYSGGGRMASQMACDHADKIAAIAPVASLRAGVPVQSGSVWSPDASTCKPKRPVSVIAFHGTADATNPYLGNDDPRWGYGVEDALAAWGAYDRCRQGPASKSISPTVELRSYGACKDEADVLLYRAAGAGHTWPGDQQPSFEVVDQSISATNLMLSFFKTHSIEKKKPKK